MPFTHRIPQNVTEYESKVIGNFTPRQFIYLAIGGVTIGLLFSIPLPNIIRWIGSAITAPVFIALALASFDGRRTDVWILNFFQAISKPTIRVWEKEEIPPTFLLPSYVVPKIRLKTPPKKASDLENFLDFWRTQENQKDYSEDEVRFLERISSLSRSLPKDTPVVQKTSTTEQ